MRCSKKLMIKGLPKVGGTSLRWIQINQAPSMANFNQRRLDVSLNTFFLLIKIFVLLFFLAQQVFELFLFFLF